MGPPGDRLFNCGAGNGGAVDAYGKLQVCMTLRHPDTVYDLRAPGATLKEGIYQFFPKVLTMKAQNPDFLAKCAQCFLKGLCEQCPAKSWMEHGTLDTPVEYLCWIAHAQAEFLGLLVPGEKAWKVVDWKRRVKHLEERVVKKDRSSPLHRKIR